MLLHDRVPRTNLDCEQPLFVPQIQSKKRTEKSSGEAASSERVDERLLDSLAASPLDFCISSIDSEVQKESRKNIFAILHHLTIERF